MKSKKVREMLICFVLCLSMLCSVSEIVRAVTPVCGGNHNFCKVSDAGRQTIGDAHVHRHGDHWCIYVLVQDMKLERCYCGTERVVPEGGSYEVHEKMNINEALILSVRGEDK